MLTLIELIPSTAELYNISAAAAISILIYFKIFEVLSNNAAINTKYFSTVKGTAILLSVGAFIVIVNAFRA